MVGYYKFSLRMAAAVACILSASTAFSQTNSSEGDYFDLSLEDLLNLEITTATKTSAKQDIAPAVIDVITGDQILQRGYQTLSHLLNDIADNHQDRANWGIGEPTSQNVGFGFRFDTGQNILILFNGQRLNAFLPGNRFGGEEYLLTNIDRIEIIRGPGSALYGTGAFTAVINIISKVIDTDKKETIGLTTDYTPTSHGFSIASNVSTSFGKSASLTGAFRYFTEEGQKLPVKNSLFGDRTLNDRVNYANDGELFFRSGKFNAYSKWSKQSRAAFTGFNGVNPSNQKELELYMHAYSAGADYSWQIRKMTLKVMGGWHNDNWTEVALIPQFKIAADGSQLVLDQNGLPQLDTLTLYRNGELVRTPFFIDGQGATTQSLDAETQLTYNYFRQNNFVFGVYAANDRIVDAVRPSELNLSPLGFVPFRYISDPQNNWLFDTNAARATIALYGQADYTIKDNLYINVGARWDNYSGTGALVQQKYSEFNPRGAVVLDVQSVGSFKLLAGSATRIPNGFETLSSVSILGNPANRPEHIRTIQFQWINNWNADLRTELGMFSSQISNRLETNASISDQLRANGFIGQFINVGETVQQKNNGIDGRIISRFNKSTLNLSFTQYFGSDNGHGQPLAYIPNTMINADFNFPINWVNVNAGFNYRSTFTQPSYDPRVPVKSYLIGRINIMMDIPKTNFQFKVTGRNIFNTKYNYPSSSLDFVDHFPARRMEWVIGIGYKPML